MPNRVLLRSPRSPFAAVPAFTLLERNLIGSNVGNLVFQDAAYRLLDVPGVTIEVDGLRVDASDADRINDSYDTYVVPFANAFRRQFEPVLDRWTALVRRLRIPVVVLGVGAQAPVDYDREPLRRLEPSTRRFVGAVLDHAPSIGVRGAFTAEWLRSLGFSDVEVIGCPSMFWHGDRLEVSKRTATLQADAAVVVTASPYRREMGPIVDRHLLRHRRLSYVAQDDVTYELLLLPGSSPGGVVRGSLTDPAHAVFELGRTRLFTHPRAWFEFLRDHDFVFGSRIHGTIAALIAGTPAVVLAHDSRTRELAEHFEIPHRLLGTVSPDVVAEQLYAEADYAPLVGGHRRRFEAFTSFLERHGLEHAFAPGQDRGAAFDERYARVPSVVLASDGSGAVRGLSGIALRSRLAARRAARSAILGVRRTVRARKTREALGVLAPVLAAAFVNLADLLSGDLADAALSLVS